MAATWTKFLLLHVRYRLAIPRPRLSVLLHVAAAPSSAATTRGLDAVATSHSGVTPRATVVAAPIANRSETALTSTYKRNELARTTIDASV